MVIHIWTRCAIYGSFFDLLRGSLPFNGLYLTNQQPIPIDELYNVDREKRLVSAFHLAAFHAAIFTDPDV